VKYIFTILFLFVTAFGAQYDIPSGRVVPWIPGTNVGIRGGIPTDRTDIINVTLTPYFAAGSITETTGTITSGSPTLTVASASTFAIGNKVRIGYVEIQDLEITAGASGTGSVTITTPGIGDGSYTPHTVDVTSGDTAAQVATKVRDHAFPGWATSGSGTTVRFTFYTPRVIGGTVTLYTAQGVTGSTSVIRAGTVAAHTTITNVAGTTITLNANASSSMTDGTVEHDDTDAIQAAIDAAVTANSGKIVYLPAGQYNSRGLDTGYGKNLTIRGAGSGQLTGEATTELVHCPTNGLAGIRVGATQTTNYSFTVTGSPAKGDSTITLGESVAGLSVNQIVRFSLLNQLDETEIEAGAAPVISVYGYEYRQRHLAIITAINSGAGTITITPAMPFAMPIARVPVMASYTLQADLVGVEDLKIDMNNQFVNIFSAAGVVLEQARECWMKNVSVIRVPQRNIEVNNCVLSEIRHCYTDLRNGLGGSNGAGLNYSTASGGLIVDNIITRQFPLIEINDGATANAFLYNFFYDTRIFGISGLAIDTNHAPHNSFNYFEGNATPNIQCDGYFGSASDDTFFRNWIYATNPGGMDLSAFILNRFTRNNNLVGNILGTSGENTGTTSFGNPNFGNGGYTGTAEPTAGDFWSDFDITGTVATSTTITVADAALLYTGQLIGISWGTNGLSQTFCFLDTIVGTTVTIATGTLPSNGTAVRIWAGIGDFGQGKGFQELDLDVENSALLKANYYALEAGGGSIPGGESIGSDTLASSLAYDSKPSWFGSLAWPAFDTTTPNQSFVAIPAGYRYINGNEDYLSGTSTATVTNLNVGTVRLAP